MMTRDQEVWGIALWIEKTHGENGWFYIAQQLDRLITEGVFDGLALWQAVQERFEALQASPEKSTGHA